MENYYKKINIIYKNNLIFILLYTEPNQLFIYIHIYKSKKNLSAKKIIPAILIFKKFPL